MHQVITFGEIMMRLTTAHHARFSQATKLEINFAGGEANVAAALSVLNIPSAFVTRLPDNDWGEAVIKNLKSWGVETNHIIRGGDRLGIFYVENGASIRASKVIYDRANSSFATLRPQEFQWEQLLQGASWFHFTGITPAISASTAAACLAAVGTAHQLGLTISADVGYRSNQWQWGKKASEVMPDLVAFCSIIVCSVRDAADLFGIYPTENEPDAFASVSRQIMERFPHIKTILTTERGQISASHNTFLGKCWDGTRLWITEPIEIANVVDRIGSGDAFIAGFIYSKLKLETDWQALQFAVAAGALKHTIAGDVNLVTVQEIESVRAGDTSGMLKR